MSEIQGSIFGNTVAERGDDVGYHTSVVCKVTGLTNRQVGHWVKNGFFAPSLKGAQGSGNRLLFTFKDILILKAFKKLLDTGISLDKIKKATEILKDRGVDDLSSVTLLSDGKTIFLAYSSDEIVNILQNGQGVLAEAFWMYSFENSFGETQGQLLPFKATTVEEDVMPPSLQDLKWAIESRKRVQGLR
ncbi:transcriptional regulator [Actinomycetota bacterium]|nr:transcriptional regulator [Actinomycetota bacterium]